MQWVVVAVLLVALVIVVAYGLGVYMRQRQGDLPPAPPARPAPRRTSPAKSIGDREVRAVVTWLLSQAFEQTGVKVADDKVAFERIVEAAESAVETLKMQDTAVVSLPFLTADVNGPKHLEARLTRSMIDELVKY
jgi:hypothetical protein